MATAIREEDGIHKDWYVEARKMTMAGLPAFLAKLTEDYDHDYGTICHAVAASAIAAAWAVDKTPKGGITGFQAGCIMWEFISHWMSYEGRPLRLVDYSEMLYPQYGRKFAKTITAATWDYILTEAKKRLEADEIGAHPNVRAHWQSIVNGVVPFGYRIVSDE